MTVSDFLIFMQLLGLLLQKFLKISLGRSSSAILARYHSCHKPMVCEVLNENKVQCILSHQSFAVGDPMACNSLSMISVTDNLCRTFSLERSS